MSDAIKHIRDEIFPGRQRIGAHALCMQHSPTARRRPTPLVAGLKVSRFKTSSSQCDGHAVERRHTDRRLCSLTPQHFDKKQRPVARSVVRHVTTVVQQSVRISLVGPQYFHPLCRPALCKTNGGKTRFILRKGCGN